MQPAWLSLPVHHSIVSLDEMVIMPNHVHEIGSIVTDPEGVSFESIQSSSEPLSFSKRRVKGPAKGALGAIPGSFKSASSRRSTNIAIQGERQFGNPTISNTLLEMSSLSNVLVRILLGTPRVGITIRTIQHWSPATTVRTRSRASAALALQ